MKAACASNALIDLPRDEASKTGREGKARAARIVALAAAGTARRVGMTYITDLTEDELRARYRRLMRG